MPSLCLDRGNDWQTHKVNSLGVGMKLLITVGLRLVFGLSLVIIGLVSVIAQVWILALLTLPGGLWICREAIKDFKAGQGNADLVSADEESFNVRSAKRVRARLRLDYIDSTGERTRRDVVVHQYGRSGRTALMRGHCSLRNATRTFRVDRIQSCVDLETGEVLTDVADWLDRRPSVR